MSMHSLLIQFICIVYHLIIQYAFIFIADNNLQSPANPKSLAIGDAFNCSLHKKGIISVDDRYICKSINNSQTT